MFSYSKPSSNEGKALPLPGINPEHDQLRYSIVKISAKSTAGLAFWAEAGWSHGGSAVLQASQDEVIGKVGDELSKSKAFWSHFIDSDKLVA